MLVYLCPRLHQEKGIRRRERNKKKREEKGIRRRERGGVFDIDVKLYFNIRFRLGDFIGSSSRVRAKCELQVPLVSRGVFLPTRCHVKF